MKPLLAVTALLAFAGCAQQPRASFAEQCQGYGYQPGTALFLDCINHRQQAAIAAVGIWQAGMAQSQAATMAPWTAVLSHPPTMGGGLAVSCQHIGTMTYCN